jgi:hypothetical protein
MDTENNDDYNYNVIDEVVVDYLVAVVEVVVEEEDSVIIIPTDDYALIRNAVHYCLNDEQIMQRQKQQR